MQISVLFDAILPPEEACREKCVFRSLLTWVNYGTG